MTDCLYRVVQRTVERAQKVFVLRSNIEKGGRRYSELCKQLCSGAADGELLIDLQPLLKRASQVGSQAIRPRHGPVMNVDVAGQSIGACESS